MTSPILPIDPGRIQPVIQAPGQARPAGDFQQALNDAIGGVERLRHTANRGVEAFLAGEGGELHQAVLATQRAELAFELFLEMRNKVVQAYQEIMRMPV
ncbi:MAG: flagellar hook-basal body complex protein FliE [Acidobacteria bacterium]|nr:flagellar hook-basal body complex protein FliE [Acidobacteriota bacterium]